MAISNYDRVGKALKLLNSVLAPYAATEMKRVFPDDALKTAKGYFIDSGNLSDDIAQWDTSAIFKLMGDAWKDVFKQKLSHADRNFVSELREARNKWAHEKPFSSDDTFRVFDTIERLLISVSSPLAEEVATEKSEILRVRYLVGAKNEARKQVNQPLQVESAHNLPAWRDVITPHADVASGRYQLAEFAADLWQVYLGHGSEEYRNPVEFFRRTYLTNNLKELLVGAARRLNGQGGDPVIRLQTNFGGGKTHSMLALYHLFSGVSANSLLGAEELLQVAQVKEFPQAKRVVLVGNKISPGSPDKKADGTVVRTLWGELAWQLGGKEGYAMVKDDDECGTIGGDGLSKLLQKYSPCLILIDEWVAYARQLPFSNEPAIPGGRFEVHFTFAQALTEAAKSAPKCQLVVSLPASDTATSPHAQGDDLEVGGERGRSALDRLSNVIGRMESTWRPATPEESFEIVRRRLFEPLLDEAKCRQRDLIAKRFALLYQESHMEFPAECRDADYERRIQAAFPIHPELFDRLYNDWSTLVRFQRTRGVLRLMATVIHSLWENGDKNPLILPSNIPIDDPSVQQELTRYLSDNWAPIINNDVDGPNSLPVRIDREVPNLGRLAATRRAARAIYIGSAPKGDTPNRGIDDKSIKLACVFPGESPAIYSDALRRLSSAATYLYQDGTRYWYGTHPTVMKLAQDRTEGLKNQADKVQQELERRLTEMAARDRNFAGIHVLPQDSSEIKDSPETRLVVLGVNEPYSPEGSSLAQQRATELLAKRGNTPRIYQNALIFLVAEKTRMQELDEALRRYLAWSSISDESVTLNLTPHLVKQTQTQLADAQRAVESRIPEVYKMMLVPSQATPTEPVKLNTIRATGGESIFHACAKKLTNDELLISRLAGSRLKMELDRVPLWKDHRVQVSELAEYFARYAYLPRLTNPNVLFEAAEDGVKQTTWIEDGFAYADSYDPAAQRYVGLKAGQAVIVTDGSRGLLVRSAVAKAQLDAEVKTITIVDPLIVTTTTTTVTEPLTKKQPTFFHATTSMDGHRSLMKIGKIDENVLAHLASIPGAEVKITYTLEVTVPSGIPDNTLRTVNENAKSLKIDTHGFE